MEITGGFYGDDVETYCFGAFSRTAGTGGHGLEVTGSGNSTINFTASKTWSGSTSNEGSHSHTITVNNTGGGKSHDNMPPYITAYCWKRIS